MSKAVRLDKFLADAGKGTRSEVKKFIQKGLVQVNGRTVKKPEQKITEENRVEFLGNPVSMAPEFVYYLLHKPAGYVSATEDRYDRTVMELIPEARKGMFPVGRLDKDTEGLLLITDDGGLAHELLSPARHGDRRRRRPQYFIDRRAGHGKIHAGQTSAGHSAAALPHGGCGDDEGIFCGGHAAPRQRACEPPPVPRAASFGKCGGPCGRRQHAASRRGEPRTQRRPVFG